ncbi:MAG: DUF4129 domain-containing protein [Weeksellaceae bacterium]
MKYFILAILFIFNTTWAQDTLQEPVPIKEPTDHYDFYAEQGLVETADILDTIDYRSDKTTKIQFDSNFQDKYVSEDYNYSMTKPRESLWAKIKRKLNDWFQELFKSNDIAFLNNYTEWILQGLAAIILGLVLYWLIKYLMGKEGGFFFSKKNKEINPEAWTITENIHEVDFNKEIQQHEQNGNYRLATRYQFLYLLKTFTDRGWITWDPDKTNEDYIYALKGNPSQTLFKQSAKIFEYVWYGEFEVEKEEYEKIKASFNHIKQLRNE